MEAARFAAIVGLTAIAAGCARAEDTGCASTEPLSTSSATTPSESATSAALAPTSSSGASGSQGASSLLVTLANVGDDHTLSLEATRGALDEAIVLLASRGAPPPNAPASEKIDLAITSAISGGASDVPMTIRDAAGSEVTSVDLAPGQRKYLRITADAFDREATYRASLLIHGAETHVYRLKIKSTAPWRPLGLRSLKWQETFDDWPILGKQTLRLELPVQSAGSGGGAFHVVVKPPAEAIQGARPLPACGITVRRIGRSDAVAVVLPPLATGRYAGTIEIQGEALAIDLTLKNSFAVVWLLVAAGALVSLLVREYVHYRTAREAVERKIAAKEREIEKKSEGLVVWDELSARNTVRMARGRKSYLALDDAEVILPDATPRERAERAAIDKAIGETQLPEPLRTELSARFMKLLRLSSRVDTAELEAGLAGLARSAQRGFAMELSGWLAKLRRRVSSVESRLLAMLDAGELAGDARMPGRLRQAFRVLGQLVDDARAVALDGGLSQGHAATIAGVHRSVATLEEWAKTGRIPEDVVHLVHAAFWKVPRPTPSEAAPIPQGLRIRARGPHDELRALDELLFEVVEGDEASAAARVVEIDEPIEWIVDRRTVVTRGGPRLSFVFEAALLWAGMRERRVAARTVNHGVIATWVGEVRRPRKSIAVVERLWAAAARGAATLVGVIVAGAAAVGVLWSGKAFGSAADYVGALLMGLGSDLTVVAGGGKILTTVLESFTKPKKEDAP